MVKVARLVGGKESTEIADQRILKKLKNCAAGFAYGIFSFMESEEELTPNSPFCVTHRSLPLLSDLQENLESF